MTGEDVGCKCENVEQKMKHPSEAYFLASNYAVRKKYTLKIEKKKDSFLTWVKEYLTNTVTFEHLVCLMCWKVLKWPKSVKKDI